LNVNFLDIDWRKGMYLKRQCCE